MVELWKALVAVWHTISSISLTLLTIYALAHLDELKDQLKPHARRNTTWAAKRFLRRWKVGRWLFPEHEAPPPVPANPPAPRDPESRPSAYNSDIFFGVRWRWAWGFERAYDWKAYDLKPYCANPWCDLPLDVSDCDDIYDRWETTFVCRTRGCKRVVVTGSAIAIVERVKALAARNRRQNWRGEFGPLEMDTPGAGI